MGGVGPEGLSSRVREGGLALQVMGAVPFTDLGCVHVVTGSHCPRSPYQEQSLSETATLWINSPNAHRDPLS